MITNGARLSCEEVAQRGQEIYEQQIQPTLRLEDTDKFVAIDVRTGNYEIDRDDYTATSRALRQHPDAQLWLVRVGHRATYRIGGHFIAGGIG